MVSSLRYPISLSVIVLACAILQGGCILPFCVTSGTLILTPSGLIPIDDVSVGDEVMCESPTGDRVVGTVAAKRQATASSYLELSLADNERPLRVTGSHPVATYYGWRPASEVKVGNLVRTPSGWTKVSAVEKRGVRELVYDITVEPHPNFFADGVLVHNKSIIPPISPEDLPGVWLGESPHHWGTLYRLELNSDGTGLCACISRLNPAHTHLYEVTSWTLKKYALVCKTRQIAADVHMVPLELRGKAVGGLLKLEVHEESDRKKWGATPVLEMVREERFLETLRNQREDIETLDLGMARYVEQGTWNSPCEATGGR